jgi:hypothetical protein
MTRPASTKVRRECFHYWRYNTRHGWRMRCGGHSNRKVEGCCGKIINPANEKWIADHEILHTYGGSDDPPNVRPMCIACEKVKTSGDIKFVAKGKRQSDSIYGVRQSRSKLGKPAGHHYDWERRRYVRD